MDALRHAKKVFRILWDAAKCVQDADVENITALRICCLDLQSEAILFILRMLKEVFQMYPIARATSGAVTDLHALFEQASSSAMKSAGMFEKATGIFTPTNTGDNSMKSKKYALLHFHGAVGDELDDIAMHLRPKKTSKGEGGIILLPASYYEYSIYRSVHQWRLLGSAETNQMQTSSVLYDQNAKGSSSKEVESMVAASTLAIVRMVLQARHCLKTDMDQLVILF